MTRLRRASMCRGEADFDAARRKVLALLLLDPDEPTGGAGNGMGSAFGRCLPAPDGTGRCGGAFGHRRGDGRDAGLGQRDHRGDRQHIAWRWRPTGRPTMPFRAFRDREVLTAMLAEVAGDDHRRANAGEKTKVLKTIIRGHLEGTDAAKA
jgi:ParB family chromosome partitioning protein